MHAGCLPCPAAQLPDSFVPCPALTRPPPSQSALQAADALHLTGRGRESEAMRHPYLAALRQLLLELLPRPSLATQQLPAATPTKGAFVSAAASAAAASAAASDVVAGWLRAGGGIVPVSTHAPSSLEPFLAYDLL